MVDFLKKRCIKTTMNFKLVGDAAKKIIDMEVRGASRIARFAAETLRDFAKTVKSDFDENMRKASEILMNTRPTAVSLFNAINYVMMYKGDNLVEKKADIVRKANGFIKWVDNAKQKIGEIGAKRIKDGWTILTHCNSSAALSVIKTAFKQGKNLEVIATESRPRYQGHLTVKELVKEGIPVTLIVDSAVRYFMKDVD